MSERAARVTKRDLHSEVSSPDELAEMQQDLERAEYAFRVGALAAASEHARAVTRGRHAPLNRRALVRRAAELEARIEKHKRLRTNQLTLLLVLLASAFLVGIMAAIEVPSITIDGVIRTRSLVVRASGPLAFADVRATVADLTQLTTLETAGRLLPTTAPPGQEPEELRNLSLPIVASDATFTVHIEDSLLSLDRLTFEEKLDVQTLTLTVFEQPLRQLSLTFGSKVSGEFQLGRRTQLWSGSVSWDFEPDASLLFQAERGARVTLKNPPDASKKQGVLDKLTITDLDLLNPTDPTKAPVLDGKLRFTDVALSPIEFSTGDRVRLDPSGSLVLSDLIWDDGLVFRLSGSIAELKVNGRSHKPSLLEWARANHVILLCSAALASLVSFLWLALQRFEIIRSQ